MLLKEEPCILQWKPSERVISTFDSCSHEGSQRHGYEWKYSLLQLRGLSGKAGEKWKT